jgi:hypothetical protein
VSQYEPIINRRTKGETVCQVRDGCFVIRDGRSYKGGETFTTNAYDAAHLKRRSLVEVIANG